jgi:hypothetical protein
MQRAADSRRFPNARRAVVCSILVAVAACSDAIAAPRVMLNPRDVGDVMPAVLDALNRIAPGIESAAFREPTTSSIRELAASLQALDQSLSQFYVREIGTLMVDYREREPNRTDGDEVSAIELMLNAVTLVVGGGYQLPVMP